MNRLSLRHLTVVGTNVAPATVEFGPSANLIRGPSDTGKSFMVDAIDFVFGSKELKEVPELLGYNAVLLGVVLGDGSLVTLHRSTQGGSIGLYRSDLRTAPAAPPDEQLSATHDAKKPNNISRFLLEEIGLDSRSVRRNGKGETHSLSFRNVAHLCIVDETQIQAKTAPHFTGQHTGKTKETSVLRVMLEDDDDSGLTSLPPVNKTKDLSAARLESLDRLVLELEDGLTDQPALDELKPQLGRLDIAIAEATQSIEGQRAERSALVGQQHEQQRDHDQHRRRSRELVALRARLELLHAQYSSDLDRLELLREAGTLLGYFEQGPCPYCGAEAEHQHLNLECEGDATVISNSLHQEVEKTIALRSDLEATLNELGQDIESERASAETTGAAVEYLSRQVDEVDDALRSPAQDLSELLAIRSDVQKILAVYEQIDVVRALRQQLDSEATGDSATVFAKLNHRALAEFSAEMSACLEAWGVPDASTVRFDREQQDLMAGDQSRAAHGKGLRAILHAAFTLGLAQYCHQRDLPHPGFVILDSPVVTYRPPDLDEEGARRVNHEVADAFYTDIQTRIAFQVIVMENVDPTSALRPETIDTPFTKTVGHGRYGFFPVASE